MKNLKLFWVTFIIGCLTTFASEGFEGRVIGKVIDSKTKEPLPYVNVEIQSIDKKIINGTITDENGFFEVKNIPNGSITVIFSFIGYDQLKKTITISKNNKVYEFKTILLNENSELLDEVVLVSEKTTVEQKIDRKVINVGKDLTSVGATASEILNNVQSVSVDSQTGNISLRGNENVRVLLDGKPTNMSSADLLKQIPSTSIKTIELITNPSAKYNPEGMSGIINIVLHKNTALGFNGSANAGLTYGLNPRYNYATNMNLRKGKVNLYANYGLRHGNSENSGVVTRNDNSIEQDFNFEDKHVKHLLKLGTDIYINDHHTVSFYTTQNLFDETYNSNTIIQGDLNSNGSSVNHVDGTSQSYDANYTIDFSREGEKLEFEANYSVFDKTQDTQFLESIRSYDLTANYDDDVVDKRYRQLYNIDYTRPLSENVKLELGVEARYRLLENNINTSQYSFIYDDEGDQIQTNIDVNGTTVDWYETTPGDDSNFTYDRNIHSAYVNYNHKINNFRMQLGARLEDYEVLANYNLGNEQEVYKDHQFSIYPSAFFTYQHNKKNQFQLSYSRRVDRPSKHQVNPIRQWSTPLLTSVGNPNLKQQFTNSFEVNYTYQHKKGSLTAGTFLRLINNNITRVINVDEFDEDRQLLSFINSDSSHRYGFEVASSHRFFKWWRMNSSADLYVQKENGIANNQVIEVQNNAFNLRMNHNFSATKKLKFQLFGMYRGAAQSIQFNRKAMYTVNTGASYKILKGKGNLNLNFNDIFNTLKFDFESDNPVPQTGVFNWESRTVFLGFRYNFGGGKNKARKRKRRNSNDSRTGEGLI